MVPAPEAGSQPGARGQRGSGGSARGADGRRGGDRPREAGRCRLDAGSPKRPPPGQQRSPEPGPSLRRPRTDAGARRPRRGAAERRSEGRPARSAPPGRAGLPGGGKQARGQGAGRSEQLFSLAAAGGEGAGTLAPGQGDSFFFFCFKRRRSRLEERGGAGEWRLGAVPAPDARPAGTRRAGPFPEGPHLGRRPGHRIPRGGAGRAGGVGGKAGSVLCPPHRGGKPRLGRRSRFAQVPRRLEPRPHPSPSCTWGGAEGGCHPVTSPLQWGPPLWPGAEGGVPWPGAH